MRKLLLLCIACSFCYALQAQTPTMQEKLYYTCKVWGFVKYYHSEVSTCHTNWDSVLLHVLPLVKSASNSTQFNDALDTMLIAAGPMALSTTYFPDTLPAELKRNRDHGWISSPVFRTDVRTVLDTIKNNFRPHAGCYVEVPDNPSYNMSNPAGGFLRFPQDSIMLPVTTYLTFPDQDHRLLQLFKFWNIVRYFNPYNYVLDVPWDTTLAHYDVAVSNAPDGLSLHYLYEKMTAAMDDAHVEGFTRNDYYWKPPGPYTPQLRLSFMDGKYVVIKSGETGIVSGDAIIAVDGQPMSYWEDSLKTVISVGNQPVFRREVSTQVLGGNASLPAEALTIEDSTGATRIVNVNTKNPGSFSSSFWDYFYYADSLKDLKWTTMSCDIGYMNMANIQSIDVPAAYAALQNKKAIIFDLRNESYAAWDLTELMYAAPKEHAKLTIPDPTYPGTYYWQHQVLGAFAPNPYTGKVILLTGPGSQSHIEWSAMALSAMPNVVRVGERTAGADGNITFMSISNDQHFGWTSLGIYYPNGDSTQRIGIVPDTFAYQTRKSLRHGHDDVLEKALYIAGCKLQTEQVNGNTAAITIHPNPANDILNIEVTGINAAHITVTITDVQGKTIISKETSGRNNISIPVDISSLQPGMYFATVNTGTQQSISKFVKQ